MPKAEVEIIPWVHLLNLRAHKEVIEYIRSLPKNSKIGLEVSPKELGRVESFFSRWPGASGPAMPTFKPGVQGNKFAFFELVFECNARNIEIIPLEAPAPQAMWRRERFGPKIEYASGKREEAFARQIESRIKKFSGKLPVIVGCGHAVRVSKILENAGIKARVNTGLFSFSERKKVIDYMWFDYYYSKAVREKNYSELNSWKALMDKTFDSFASMDYADTLKDLKRQFNLARAVRIERLARKLDQSKAKFALAQKRVPAKRITRPK